MCGPSPAPRSPQHLGPDGALSHGQGRSLRPPASPRAELPTPLAPRSAPTPDGGTRTSGGVFTVPKKYARVTFLPMMDTLL